MAAKAKGEVIETPLKSGMSFALRFPAYGERPYVTLGFDHEGWTPETAQERLDNILAEVQLGIYVPPKKKRRRQSDADATPATDPSEGEVVFFGPFAIDLVKSRKGQVSENTTPGEEWALSHLLPFFGDWPLPEIDAEAVDDYREFKVRESEARARAIERRKPQRNSRNQILKPLSPGTINKTIDSLRFILGVALERKRKTGVTENAAVGKRRRMKLPPRRPVHLDTAGQIEALLEAAAEMDRDPLMRSTQRQAILAMLIFAGPRAHELCNLLWRDVDLANGRIFIGRSKTQAGLREIPMHPIPILRDVLAAHKAATYRGDPEEHVFLNVKGGVFNKDTLRKGTEIAVVFKRAPELLFPRSQNAGHGQNALVIRVQPDEGVTIRFGSKVPGAGTQVRDVTMDFGYGHAFTEASPEAYERLILDVLLGDPPLFPRHEEVELSWRILDPIERFWTSQGGPLEQYSPGSWGPASADEMLARDGRTWRRP